jgi:hypothetical protein
MRIFEVFIIITITAMAVNLIFLKRNKFNLIHTCFPVYWSVREHWRGFTGRYIKRLRYFIF